jgi:hypothetical protein
VTDRAPERVAAVATVAVLAAACVLALGARRGSASTERAAWFQRATGGLGSGPATSLAPCPAAFDGGVAGRCAGDLDPVPGGRAYCIHHAGPALGR